MSDYFNIVNNTPGTYSFVVPSTVSTIVVEVWGPGGPGNTSGNTSMVGASGGGGGYARKTYSVTPGQTIDYIVGAPTTGLGTIVYSQATVRETGVTFVKAQGGQGFLNSSAGGAGTIGDVLFSGGGGQNGSATNNGGAGGSAGNNGNGGGGVLTAGGAGGAALASTSPINYSLGAGGAGANQGGSPGTPGGGGAGVNSLGTIQLGGPGQVIIHYPNPHRVTITT